MNDTCDICNDECLYFDQTRAISEFCIEASFLHPMSCNSSSFLLDLLDIQDSNGNLSKTSIHCPNTNATYLRFCNLTDQCGQCLVPPFYCQENNATEVGIREDDWMKLLTLVHTFFLNFKLLSLI